MPVLTARLLDADSLSGRLVTTVDVLAVQCGRSVHGDQFRVVIVLVKHVLD
jgi:hypothetical protein